MHMLPYEISDGKAIFLLVVFLGVLVASIHTLQETHATEIYLIWYINSFFFVLFFGLGILAEQQHVPLTAVCKSYAATCTTVYDYLTDVDTEAKLLVVVAVLAIVPQVMTYVLSGLSGSASSPRFVALIQDATVWGFVKFTSGLGGILTGELLARWLGGDRTISPGHFVIPFSYTVIAFTFALSNVFLNEVLHPGLQQRAKATFVGKFHAFFTRHTRKSDQADKIID